MSCIGFLVLSSARFEIERQFFNLLKMSTDISPSIYSKYYFALYTFAYEYDVIVTFHPLTKERAQKLQVSKAEE